VTAGRPDPDEVAAFVERVLEPLFVLDPWQLDVLYRTYAGRVELPRRRRCTPPRFRSHLLITTRQHLARGRKSET
jgi:hypothetical protein